MRTAGTAIAPGSRKKSLMMAALLASAPMASAWAAGHAINLRATANSNENDAACVSESERMSIAATYCSYFFNI